MPSVGRWRKGLERVWRWAVDSLLTFGLTQMYGVDQAEELRRLAERRGRGPYWRNLQHEPPPGHPERLRPDIPPTEDELWLGRQLQAAYHWDEEGPSPA